MGINPIVVDRDSSVPQNRKSFPRPAWWPHWVAGKGFGEFGTGVFADSPTTGGRSVSLAADAENGLWIATVPLMGYDGGPIEVTGLFQPTSIGPGEQVDVTLLAKTVRRGTNPGGLTVGPDTVATLTITDASPENGVLAQIRGTIAPIVDLAEGDVVLIGLNAAQVGAGATALQFAGIYAQQQLGSQTL